MIYMWCYTSWNKFHRKKFEVWTKKYQVHEQLEIDFDIAIEDKPNIKSFHDELKDKTTTMSEFKKTWMKFQTSTEAYLKIDVALPGHALNVYMMFDRLPPHMMRHDIAYRH